MYELSWTAQSRRDVHRINVWLSENADPEVAARMIMLVRGRADLLVDYPFSGAVDWLETRRLRVPGTPYLLLYRINAARVQILRVRHAREDRDTSVESQP